MRGKILTWLVWGPKWETLKKMGLLCGGKLRWHLVEEGRGLRYRF